MFNTLILIIIGIGIIPFMIHKSFKFMKQRKIKKNSIVHKIEKISINIKEEINQRNDKPYFNKISDMILNNYPMLDINKDVKIRELTNRLSDIDNLYISLKYNFRLLDKFESFQHGFKYKKRKYKQKFNESLNILNITEEKYSNIKKYLTTFNPDFNNIRKNEIKLLNQLVKDSITLHNEYNVIELKEMMEMIIKLDTEISMMIDEPGRLRDKLLKSEDNITQLENELLNKKGSLYFKVLETLKYNKIKKEDTDKWNIIKKTISDFRRNKLLKNDIIELSNKLNNIIDDLSNLNDKIKSDSIENYITDNNKIVINNIIK